MIARIESELKDAMRARDEPRVATLRLTLSSLRSAEKELGRPLKEDEELQVLQRERKRRVESIKAFRDADREEQAEREEVELTVLEALLPAPLSEEELERIVDDAIAETGATSLRDLGRVMADVMPQVAGRADGSGVSQLVREKLAEPLGRASGGGAVPLTASYKQSLRSAQHPRAAPRYAQSGWRSGAARRPVAWRPGVYTGELQGGFSVRTR